MARNRSNTRGRAHSYPRGILSVMRGGFGFVQTAEGEFFIPAGKMNGAFDGDLVEISPARQERSRKALAKAASSTKKREARVKRVVEHAHPSIVGRYEIAEPFGVVIPEDPRIPYDIFTMLSENAGIPEGSIVRVEIATYPSNKEAATGTIVEVLGDQDDERVPIDLIVARHKFETSFSDAALAQAADAAVDAEGALNDGYEDLRDRFIFTIDPVDAKDFDDAVSIEPVILAGDTTPSAADNCEAKPEPSEPSSRLSVEARANRSLAHAGAVRPSPLSNEDEFGKPLDGEGASKRYWRLGVHIADVSHYVPWASSVDLDARRRATSVYLVDRVLPMLPEELSNDVCSLRPGQDRRTMTVDMLIDDEGKVVKAKAYPALIRSCARLTYEQAQAMLDAGTEQAALDSSVPGPADESSKASALPEGLAWRIDVLSRIAKQRSALRKKAGGVDFDTDEAKVRLDEQGAPIAIEVRKRTEATQLIEEAMIAANEAVARLLRDGGFPCVYRVHEKPSRESLDGLVPVLREFSWFKRIDVDLFVAGNPHVVASVLEECQDRSEAPLVTTLVLRSMKRALYEAQLGEHYALASEAYAHFTSPIRRYPDLVVHRMLKALLLGKPQKFDQEVANLAWIAEHSSEMERIADRAAAESQEVKIVELMETHIGETFSAMIAGVATFGLFVRLDNTAEGVVEMADLGHEYFVLDPVRHTLTGSDSGKEYRLGKHVAVRLVEADRRTRTLRFRLVKRA